MSIPRVTLSANYQPRAHDLLLLLYLNGKKAAFSEPQIPAPLWKQVKAPADRGGRSILFRGEVAGKMLLAIAKRLDKEHSNPRLEAKKAVARALDTAKAEKCGRVVVVVSQGEDELVAACHEGAVLGGYIYDEYLSKKPKPIDVQLVTPKGSKLQSLIKARQVVFDCQNFARDVLNKAPNDLKPPELANEFKKFGKESGLTVQVWDEKKLKQERCGGVLAVGMGSEARPRMVIAEYKPTSARGHLCLVGKGVTFDTGGYGLKPAALQIGMKLDMGGAAAVFAAACAIAKLKLRVRVTCITPLAENMVSGSSFHTTSVLRTRSGKTVEVMHTDAEGRLILADALTLAEEKKPDWIIDAATLTGATVVALGEDIAGLYGNSAELIDALIKTGSSEDELFWEMPLHRPYAEKLKSVIADMQNRGDRWGGGIAAALFLKEFVSEEMKWVHIDLAGPGGKENPLDHLGKGAKGFGVKTLVALAERLVHK